jgi:hypothetical protein
MFYTLLLLVLLPPTFLQDLKRSAIVEMLDACLLTDEEMAAGKSAEQWMAEDPLFGPDE